MKKVWLAAGLAVLATAVAAPSAMAIPNHPSKSTKLSFSFVTAYNTCAAPNTTHKPAIALPACTPPVPSTNNNPTNKMEFGPKGTAATTLAVAKGDIKLTGKGTDILNNGTPFSGTVTGVATVRPTDNGCGGPSFTTPCTVFDFPFPVPETCTAGKCSLKTSANTVVPGAISVGDNENIEVGQLAINDPDGDPGVRQGLYIP